MTQAVFRLEPVDNFHVFHTFLVLNKYDPVFNWLTVFFFYGRKVRSRTGHFFIFRHLNFFNQKFCNRVDILKTANLFPFKSLNEARTSFSRTNFFKWRLYYLFKFYGYLFKWANKYHEQKVRSRVFLEKMLELLFY